MNDKIKAYYRSFIDQDVSGVTLTGDFAPTASAVDRLKATYAVTSGKETDGEIAEFIIDMGDEHNLNTIILKSNFKTFSIYKEVAESWVDVTTYSANTSAFLIISLTAFSITKLKISVTHTITANQEKKLYLCAVTKYIGEFQPEKLKITDDCARADWENVYGGNVQVVKYPNYSKVKIELGFDNLQGADYTIVAALKTQARIDSYLVYLYFSDTYALLGAEALYLVNDLDDFENSPAAQHLYSGVISSMDLREC